MRSINRSYLNGWELIAKLVREEGRSFSGRERHCCFLNTGGEKFAQVSSATGLDFIDDGRGSALIDWDFDGDLDLWITNRTGPRVRYMQNEAGMAGNFFSIHLTGSTCNRDAIGARVEVVLPGDKRRHVKTLHAGDGFLSQSSKWLHFGIGEALHVERLIVSWPDGKKQEFEKLKANGHYRLLQDGDVESWSPQRSQVHLAAIAAPVADESDKIRVILAPTKTMSSLPVAAMNGEKTTLADATASGPMLINLWQTTCVPCLKELNEFSKKADEIRAAGLNVVALHLSDPKASIANEAKSIQTIITRFNFPFDTLIARDNCVDRLNKLQRRVLQKHIDIALPSSILVNGDGKIVAVYKGAVSVEQLVADAKLLNASEEELLAATLPFAGKWYRSPLEE